MRRWWNWTDSDRESSPILRRSVKTAGHKSGGHSDSIKSIAPLKLREAGSIEEALLFFDGLKALHTERWRSKGRNGSFANSRWEAFHRALVRRRFPEREIGLLEISNSDGPVGYLYNFLWRDRVYVLQTGFRMQSDRRFMPGYVVHALAIAHYKKMGMKFYDLMHGDSLYKERAVYAGLCGTCTCHSAL